MHHSPLIVTSNHPPKSVYKNCYRTDVESLEDRFLVVQVHETCHLKPKLPPLPPIEDSQDFPTPPYNPTAPDALHCNESLLLDSEDDGPTPLLSPNRDDSENSSSVSSSSLGDSVTTALEKLKKRKNPTRKYSIQTNAQKKKKK